MDVCRKMTTNMLGTGRSNGGGTTEQQQRNDIIHHIPPHEYNLMINFEETELRLGLPGGGGGNTCTTTTTTVLENGGGGETTSAKNNINSGKRGFSQTIDLELNLESKQKDRSEMVATTHDQKKNINNKNSSSSSSILSSLSKEKNLLPCSDDPEKPSAPKAQVVGWPPVRSFRKNIVSVNQKSNPEEEEKVSNNAAFVKVSMDGAPYLRKVDLKMYKSYQDFSSALGKMFSSFTNIGNCGSQGMKDFMNESKLMDLLNSSEYVPTYEDKDGDWMLVGDVPWAMFVDSCKRLRIMKGSEAIGLAPRAVEKCKNRS